MPAAHSDTRPRRRAPADGRMHLRTSAAAKEVIARAAASLGSMLQAQGRGHWQPASAANSLGAGTWRGMLAVLFSVLRSKVERHGF